MYEKFTYERIAKVFEDKKCKIITTKEEFTVNNLTCKKNFRYFAVCGHEKEIRFAHFNNSNTGLYCKDCVSINKSVNMKSKVSQITYDIEKISYDYIYKNIKNNFDIYKTFDGCTADLLIKPKNNDINKWMLVQLKSATKYNINGNYTFSHTKGYNNYNLICIGIDKNNYRTWIMNGSLTNNFSNITITSKNSKYNKYFIEQDELCNNLLKNYYDDNFKKINLEDEITLYQDCFKNEQLCRINRNNKCKFLTIVYPDLTCCKHDCIINNYKIQDKSGTFNTQRSGITFNLNHLVSGKKHSPYTENDNDFYWLSSVDTSIFFVIPEAILIKHNYIKTETQEGKRSITLYPNNVTDSQKILTRWAFEYMFDYDNLNVEKLQTLLKPKELQSVEIENDSILSITNTGL